MAGDNIRFSNEALDGLMADVRANEISRGTKGPRHPSADELWAYLNDTGSWLLTRNINRHLAACKVCASRVKTFKESCRAWQGSEGEARLEKIRKRLRQADQREIEFPVAQDTGAALSASNTLEQATQAAIGQSAREKSVREVLYEAGAIETGCDYVLPNGLHADIHVNLSRICRSEGAMEPIVRALGRVLKRENFDTLVSTSWALAAINRRLVNQRAGPESGHIQHIMVEGYDPPCIFEAVRSGARVILLVDVVVTGSQIAKVTEELKRQKAASIKAIAIVDAVYPEKQVPGPFESLCRLPINIAPSTLCPRCGTLPRAEFNPVAGRMTKKKFEPRSPSEFLKQDPVARQFWEFVDIAGAFEHHRIIGRRHYIGFIDTARLLRNRLTGETIVKDLCQRISEHSGIPDTVLVPARAKSLLLGRCLVEGFRSCLGRPGVRLASVRQHSGHFSIRGSQDLSGQRVLVADVAAGHGDTLDELALFLSPRAASVAGAILLSRLSEACEEAFDQRLSGGFTKLYSMPVRPLTVRDKTRITCSVCLRRQDLKEAVGELPAGVVKEVAKRLAATPRFRSGSEKRSSSEHQIPLCIMNPLATYRPNVASGIALHALHAAMGDGMAPLSLPEIDSPDIPAARRAALVADLPAGVLKWSGQTLVNELCEFLKKGVDRNVWIATVELMSRSGSAAWVDSLREAVINAERCGNWMDEQFWARMILIVFRLIRNTPETSEQLRGPLEELVQSYPEEAPAQPGLKAMLDATYQCDTLDHVW
jgi:orotate phosphoribosyltransferase